MHRVLSGVLGIGLAIALAACGGGGGSGGGSKRSSSNAGSGSDTTRPTVVSVSPANAAASVSPNATVTVTYSEPVAGATVSSTEFTVTPQGGSAIAATILTSSAGSILTPASPLVYATAYTVRLSTGIKDAAGNSLVAFQSTFTTAAAPGSGEGQPTVTSVDPANGTNGVSTSSTVTVTFSSPVTGASVTNSSFTLTPSGGSAIAATVIYDGELTAVLTPSAALEADTAYTVNLSSDIQNGSSQSLVPFQSSFQTAATPDTTPPHVSSISPADGAEDVAVGQAIQVTFNEAVSLSPLDDSTFSVSDGAAPVPGIVTYDVVTRRATFTPNSSYAYGTLYTVSLSTGITDISGNELDAFTASFTTTAAPDLTAPTVVSTSPADSATDVSADATITVLFSEDVNPDTITGTTFLVNDGEVPGSVTYNAATKTAVFTTSAGLAAGVTYTATLTTGIEDVSGNALESAYTWQFSTAATEDVTPPTVSATTPVADATGISAGLASVSATFSEAMSAGSLNATTFTLTGPSGPVGGTVSYDGATQRATFAIAGSLATSTAYTATIGTGATDLTGNGLASAVTWTFTTAAPTEVIAPGVTQTVNEDGSTGVDVDFSGLDAEEIQGALDTLQELLDGTLPTGGPLTIVMTGDPENPLALEVPLIITRSDVNISVTPAGTITLDGAGVLDPETGDPIDNIVEVSGNNVTLDGINVVNGQVDLITQPGGATSGVQLKNLVLHDAVTDDCINLRDCTDCVIENVQAYRCFKKGLQLTGVSNITIRNVTIGVGPEDAGPITCDPDDAGDTTCQFGSNSPRAFVEIFKSTGGLIDGLTIYASRVGSAGTGQAAPDGSAAFGNGILLNQSSGNFTIKNVTIRDSAMAAGGTPHGLISIWNHATASTITLENLLLENNPFKAFSFAKKSGVNTVVTVTTSTVEGNTGGMIEVMNGPFSCTFSGNTLDGDPSAFCAVVP